MSAGEAERAPGSGRALGLVAAVAVAFAVVAGACAPRAQPTAPAVAAVPAVPGVPAVPAVPDATSAPSLATPVAGAAPAAPSATPGAAAPAPSTAPAGAGSPLAASAATAAGGAPPTRSTLALRTAPLDGVAVASVRFLAGAARLMSATGDESGAERASRLMEEVQARAEPTNAQLTELGAVAEAVAEIARDTARLDRALVGAVTQAAVEVGVATVLERRAVEAAREARYWPLIVSAEGPRARRLLASPVPANLQAMETIQTRLFRYLGARGIDPLPSVRAALAEL